MAALTVAKRYVQVTGPRKREIIFIDGPHDVTGTVESDLQNPMHVTAHQVAKKGEAADSIALAWSATISGRTITLTGSQANDHYLLEVEGF